MPDVNLGVIVSQLISLWCRISHGVYVFFFLSSASYHKTADTLLYASGRLVTYGLTIDLYKAATVVMFPYVLSGSFDGEGGL